MVTERDVVYGICAHETSSRGVRVQDIMCCLIATIEPYSIVEGAAHVM
jgi:hypothetical protein